MIKIQNDIENLPKDPLAQALLNEETFKQLKNSDIDIGNHKNPDYVFAMANDLQEPKPNTIAFERIDGCQIKNKKLLKNPNIAKLVKMYHYGDWTINNLPCVEGRIFTRHLEKDEMKYRGTRIEITKEDAAKVVLGLSFLYYKRHDPAELFARGLVIQKQRDIDVFFAGTTKYNKHGTGSGRLVEGHRLSCIGAIKKTKGIRSVLAFDRVYRYGEYLSMLANTKITVSPWGWGESCYRDYEAIFCGVELIKPASYRIESNPDIYNDRFMHFCRPDWSDLPAVIQKVMDNYESRNEIRQKNNQYLIAERQPKRMAEIIKEIVNE